MKKILLVLATILWALCVIGSICGIFRELPTFVHLLMAIGYLSMVAVIICRYRQVNKKKPE